MTKLQGLYANLRCFWRNERGATSIEYAIIAVGIAVVIIVAVNGIGSAVKSSFTAAQNGFN